MRLAPLGWGLAALPVFLTGWAGLFFPGRWAFAAVVLVFAGQALSVIALQSLLEGAIQRLGGSMRAAFLGSLGLSIVLAITARLTGVGWPGGAVWAAILLGAAVGALSLTVLRTGLWEDNFPPSPEVQEAVLQAHRREIGHPGPPPRAKRTFDIALSLLGLILASPLMLLIALVIWLDEPGPVLFVKNSTGKGGVNFHQFKFRTMIRDAERETGPVMANQGDQRVLWIGRFLRKTALDELPQLYNILVGEMSFVGPRPQRTVLVREYLEQVPGYPERHRVAPGLAGLAQVMGSYYISQEEKLAWDRIYIRHMSLGFDLRIILLAFAIVFWLRWQKGWEPGQSRGWLGIAETIQRK